MGFYLKEGPHGFLPPRQSPSHNPTVPVFSTTPETVFTLSFNEDISKQLGNKSQNQGCSAHQETDLKQHIKQLTPRDTMGITNHCIKYVTLCLGNHSHHCTQWQDI